MFSLNLRLVMYCRHATYCRYVDPEGPLPKYDWLEAYCRLLQQHIAGGLFARVGVLRVAHLLRCKLWTL